jgi:hypothetical protein
MVQPPAVFQLPVPADQTKGATVVLMAMSSTSNQA